MKHTRILLLTIAAMLSSCALAPAQSRTNTIYRPCPNTTVKALVEVQSDGDINVAPCSGGDIVLGAYISALYNDRISLATPHLEASSVNRITLNATTTAGGTTGNRTINTPAGTVNFAAGTGATGITVTSNITNTGSYIFTTVRTNDATCSVKNVVPANGSFVIVMTANCMAETSVGFLVVNQ